MRPSSGRVSFLSLVKGKAGYIFLACVFVLCLQGGLFSGKPHHDTSSKPHPQPVPSRESHPIPALMDEAERKYREKLKRQSQTLEEGVREYHRRYGRAPPKGFDAWWQFAKKNEAVMVDEYDVISEDLEPFWGMEGQEVRRRALQVGELPSISIVRIRNGNMSVVNLNPEFKDSEVGARAAGFSYMLKKFVHLLPDMDFPVNAKAEGRVVVPWEHRAYPNMTVQDSSIGIEAVLKGRFRADWADDGNVWDAWRRTCPLHSPARRVLSSLRNRFSQTHSSSSGSRRPEFTFPPTTAASTIDFCDQPHAHYTQGHFFSDWRTLPVLYPVFSPAKAQGFADIRIPSHYYYGRTTRYTYAWDNVNKEEKERDVMDVEWEEKKDQVFWRGATTGGGSHPPGWAPGYQRHRFVRMLSDNSSDTRLVTFAVPSSSPSETYQTLPVPIGRLNEDLADAAFVTFVGDPESYPGGPEALVSVHRFGNAVPIGEHWRYKYLVDLDGMGYSGRFMAFLASGCVPLKATVYEEYWRDWIQPWLHFIPLSATYDELYNIHAYFSGPSTSMMEVWKNSTSGSLSAPTTITGRYGPKETGVSATERDAQLFHFLNSEGDRRLRRIAKAGQQWKRTIGRRTDMEVYVYRLALEWARLVADDREAMGFTL